MPVYVQKRKQIIGILRRLSTKNLGGVQRMGAKKGPETLRCSGQTAVIEGV